MTKAKEKTGGGPSTDDLLKRFAALEKTQADLQLALDERDKKILELEARIEAAGEDAVTIMGRQVQERHIGKRTVPSRTWDPKKKEYVEGETEIDMYEYLVDLAPAQGTQVTINNIPFIHDTVVKVDLNTLRTLKEMIARGWWHEAQINGNQESKFRKPQGIVLSGNSGGRMVQA